MEYSILSSESGDSDTEFSYHVWSVLATKRKKEWESLYLRRRNDCGEFHTLFDDLTADQFKNYFRMSRDQFNELLDIIHNDITACDTNYRKAIGPKEKLAICLR